MGKIYVSFLRCVAWMIVLGFTSYRSSAVVVTINATGTTGSYRTGSVNSSGTINDGNMTSITSSSYRGFASFDLSSIPVGAVVNSVSLTFTTYSSTSSTASNPIYGFTGDPSTMTGSTLYTNAGSGSNFNSSSWTANAANTKTLNAAGIAFIQNNAGNAFVNLGFVRGSTNTYNIYGYPGTSTQQPALTIDYTAPTPCNGPITPITAASSTSAACVGTAFTITSSGVAVGTSGVAYQWQTSAPSANAFIDVATGGTSASLAISSQTTATDYRLRVICTNSNDTTYSNVLAIGQNPFYNCYCTPVTTCTNEGIENVDFNSGAINNPSTFCANSGYSDYSGLGASATVTQAQVVPISVTAHINSNPASAGVWIDYDHSGTFDASEYTSLGSSTVTIPSGGTTYVFSGNIQISPTAMTGITRMRVRSANQNGITNTSSCISSSAFGEFEDYLITINAGTACSGIPTAGSITTAPTSVCPSTNFTLTASGFSNGVTGLNYLWEVYNTGTTTWDPAPGTNNTFTYTGNITASTDFRFTATCTNGNGTASTTPVTVAISPFNQCYCTPATTSTSYYINNFSTTNGLQNISKLASGYSTGGYANYSGTDTVALLENGSFNFSTNFGSSSTYTFGIKVWVDWNHNGILNDAGEEMYVSSGYATSFSGTITAPAGAMTGFTRMRIGANYNSSTGPTTPCTNFANGEYEDYTLNLVQLVPCNGTPTAGTATAPANVCPNASFMLQASGFTTGSGLTYSWEESPAGAGSWTPIGTATTANYTVTAGITSGMDYRFKVTCANGGSFDISNIVTVSLNPFYNCYCTPASNCTNEGIENVTFDVINNNSTFCTNATGYSDFSSLGANASVTQGQNVTISVTAHINSNPASAGVWIDYDQSGTFDTSEYTLIGSSTGVTTPATQVYSTNFIIPVTAMTGITRMRVRSANQSGIAKTSACTNSGVYGEYEDYLINITAATNCSGMPTAGTVNAPATVCPNIPFSLSTTGTTNGALGLSYQWQVYNTSTLTWDPAPGTNNGTTYAVPAGITTPTDYRMMITCANGGGFDFTNTATVGISPVAQCYCTPGGTNSSYYINDLSTTGGSININKTGTGFQTGGYGDFTTTDTLQLMASNSFTLNAQYGSGTNTFGTKIWIDFGADGDFSTAGDLVYTSSSYANTFSTTINIPATATPITTRMRIGISYTPSSGPAGPCSVISGEFEDYTIVILPAPSCVASTGLGNAAPGYSTATLIWGAVPGAAGYQYVVDQTATDPTGAGTPTTDTFYNASGLAPASVYYLHVRTNCGSGNFSTWSTQSFYTTVVNDSCVNAIAVPWTGTISGDNTFATNDALPSVTCGSSTTTTGTYHGLWYTVTPATSGTMTISACVNAFDTYMRIYEGSCGGFTTCTGYDDDGCSSGNGSEYTFSAVANTTYYVLLGTYGSGSSPNSGTFTLTVTGVPLSIKLENISATNAGTRNRIDWVTGNEEKGDKFELERSSDASNFELIGLIGAKGEASKYTYWDEAPLNGINYYRLKMVDANGSTSYSKTVSASTRVSGQFSVDAYPNPVKDNLTVVAHGTDAQDGTVTISDLSGKVVRTVKADGGYASLDMKNLAAGFYIVKYSDKEHTQTLKVTKQ